MPSVSVVVSTYNAGPAVLQTLDSALAQTLRDIEIIVVDDASTDGTAELIARERPSVDVYRQALNGGVSRARNRGMAQATAPFVIFLDQDDLWHPLMLERQVACLQSRPDIAAVACPYQFWFPGEDGRHALPQWPEDPGSNGLVPGYEGWTYHRFLLDCWALTSATLLRRACVVEVGGFDERLPYSEDWDLWIRLARRYRFVQLTWPAVQYRQHAQQGSRAVRDVDYRSELLQRAASEHGLRSPDGAGITLAEFRSQVALYRMEFGYHHLQHGSRSVALRSIARSWALQPARWRRLAMLFAASAGWRPTTEPAQRRPQRPKV